jgi:Zn-dependent metalloprotease
LLFACLAVVAGSVEAASVTGARLVALRAVAPDQTVFQQRGDGRIAYLRAARQPVPVAVAGSPDERARIFVTSYRDAFVDPQTPLELRTLKSVQAGPNGRGLARYQQTFRGLPVRGGELIVHLDERGITALNSKLVSGLGGLDVVPKVDADSARAAAATAAAKRYGPRAVTLSQPQLEIVDVNSLQGRPAAPARLAWFVEVSGRGVDEYVWVDAQRAHVLLQFSQVAHAHAFSLAITDYNGACPDPVSPPPPYDENADYSTAPPDAANAFTHLDATYHYFLDTLGRDGLRGDPVDVRTIPASVRVCASAFTAMSTALPFPIENASWSPSEVSMLFGAGMTAADDIVGHEYTHALIEETAKFNMVAQSGAIAEAYADIFGELVDVQQATANDGGDARWAIGEDAPNGPFRNLLTPEAHQQPTKMSDSAAYYCGIDVNVAVHTNSSVLSHAFALLVDGGQFNGFTISGIGADKAAKVFYRTLTGYLTATATFAETYQALLAAADQLIQEGVMSDADKAELGRAIEAVELNKAPCSTQTQYCPTGYAPEIIFYDGFENTASGNWNNAAITGINHWDTGAGTPGVYHMVAKDPYADLDPLHPERADVPVPRTGRYGLWGDGARSDAANNRRGDSVVGMANPLTLPGDGILRLQFESRFKFEMNNGPNGPAGLEEFDGGVIEYSLNGVDWIDAGALVVAGTGYSGSLLAGYGNSLEGRNAFVGMTDGYISTQLDLSAFAGQPFRLRFRVGTDSFGGNIGWFIDDFAIYQCKKSQIVVSQVVGLETSESGGAATFTVALASPPSGMVVVALDVDATVATLSPRELTFFETDWNVPKTVTVTGIDDGEADGAQDYVVTVHIVSSTDPAFQESAAVDVHLTNADNDVAVTTKKKKKGGGSGDLVLLLLLIPHLYFRRRFRWNLALGL